MLTTTPPTYDCDALDEPECCECHGATCNACEPGSRCRACNALWAAGEWCGHAQAIDNENARWEAAE